MKRIFLMPLMTALLSMLGMPAMSTDALKVVSEMPGVSHKGPLSSLTAEERKLALRLKTHVAAVAGWEHNMTRYAELEQAAAYLERELTSYGYEVHRQAFTALGRKVRNVEVALPPANPNGKRPELLVIGAHYDSANGTPGANDNGSGTAAVLEMARMLRNFRSPINREIRLVLFVNEEAPYYGSKQMGSWVHANSLKAQNEQVAGMLSLETIGYYADKKDSQKYPPPLASLYPDTGNFIAFVSNPDSLQLLRRAIASFRAHAAFPSEGLAATESVPGVDLSDHRSYWQFGYPAIMLTDTAFYRYPYYHTVQDTPDKVDYERLARVVNGLVKMVRDLASQS